MQQKFYVEYQKEGFYKITSVYTNRSLTIQNSDISEGNNIVEYDYQGLDSQKWMIRDTHVNGWLISSFVNPELSISIQGNIENGSKLVLAKTNNSNDQMLYTYIVSKVERQKENGIYKMAVGKVPSKSIEIKGADISDNAIAGIWDYGNAMQQKFYFEYQEEGFYKITAMHTRKSLTVKDGEIKEGSELVQCDYQGLDSQKWIFSDSHVNGWVITSYINPQLSLTVSGNIENGSKIILANNENNDKQMLYLYNITQEEKIKSNGIYKLAIGKDPSLVMNVFEGSTENNATIDIQTFRKYSFTKVLF